jgi:hypothetical protein
MIGSRFAAACAFGAAMILSAPFVQQLFTVVSTRWPEESRALGIAASAVPAAAVLFAALRRIRDRRPLRYVLAALGAGLAVAYILMAELTFTEAFHFVEYGILAILFYRVWPGVDDWSIVALPLLAGAAVGSVDEWFQWFIPIRAGEARDVLINVVATACGLLVAVAVDPPARMRLALDRRSRRAVTTAAGAALVAFGLFFLIVHVGYDVHDPEIGSFRSRYDAAELGGAARDRAVRWRAAPPIAQRRLGREDHYLSEALWHVQRRNRAWEAGDAVTAWRENRILEKFYAPVLETPTYADPAGHRWPEAQRGDAAARVGGALQPYASDAYVYPLYTWPGLF